MNDSQISECIFHGSYSANLNACPICQEQQDFELAGYPKHKMIKGATVAANEVIVADASYTRKQVIESIKAGGKGKNAIHPKKLVVSDSSMKPLKFFVALNPETKDRPRFGGGKVYSTKKTSDFEKAIASAAQVAIAQSGYIVPEKHVPLLAIIQFYRATKHRADTDNLLKACLDALNGVAYADDSQILMHVVTMERGVGKDRAGLSIEIRYYFEELGILDNLVYPNL